jgi:hypothetical protein
MDEIDELAETVPVSLYTFRLTDSALERLLQMPRDAKGTYAEATLALTVMSALLALDELENSRVAHELIRLRLRVPIVHYLTSIHPKPLRMRWRQLHGESPHEREAAGLRPTLHHQPDDAGQALQFRRALQPS